MHIVEQVQTNCFLSSHEILWQSSELDTDDRLLFGGCYIKLDRQCYGLCAVV